VALSQIDNVSPNLGQSYIIDSFMVVVFGGRPGNLWGTLVGAFHRSASPTNSWNRLAGAVLGKIAILVLIILFIQKTSARASSHSRGRAVEA